MGEIADDMINGRCCSECGCYFYDHVKTDGTIEIFEHGYPVLCWDCFDPKVSTGLLKAEVETL
jgi:hypothetical protein